MQPNPNPNPNLTLTLTRTLTLVGCLDARTPCFGLDALDGLTTLRLGLMFGLVSIVKNERCESKG